MISREEEGRSVDRQETPTITRLGSSPWCTTQNHATPKSYYSSIILYSMRVVFIHWGLDAI